MKKIIIEEADNGYIINSAYIDSDGEKSEIKIVAEMTSDEHEIKKYGTSDEEKIALGKLLELVASELGEIYQKYQKNNLRVDFRKKGHKVDDI